MQPMFLLELGNNGKEKKIGTSHKTMALLSKYLFLKPYGTTTQKFITKKP